MSSLKSYSNISDKLEYIDINEGVDIKILAECFVTDMHHIQENDGKEFIIDHIKDQLKYYEKQINLLNKSQQLQFIQAINSEKNDYEALYNTVWQMQKKPTSLQSISHKQIYYKKIIFFRMQNVLPTPNRIKIFKNKQYDPDKKVNQFRKLINIMKNELEKRLQKLTIESNSPIFRDFKLKLTKVYMYKKQVKKLMTKILNQEKNICVRFVKDMNKIRSKYIMIRVFHQLDNEKNGGISTDFKNLVIDQQNFEKIKLVLLHMKSQYLISINIKSKTF
ncbi:unnamed protein product [Paramecium sonneborni]|uniref:Uncharacterized protein n=1 Tax=Paramecium sonneborni TaxID=65129 RepID=A0A8S1P7Q9_9CILI|nr:unnamed protein product [Paramecium sonneborni]